MNISKEEITSAINTVIAIGQTIKELKEVPSGHLYAQLCGKMSLESYQATIRMLTNAGLIKVENHLITYIG
jgi:hypothetical protein